MRRIGVDARAAASDRFRAQLVVPGLVPVDPAQPVVGAVGYAGFLMLAGALLLTVVWVFLLRDLPYTRLALRTFAPAAACALAFLLVVGLLGGWLLSGRMLAPLTRITAATRMTATGSLSYRIRLSGRSDEFRELADASTPCWHGSKHT